MARLVLGPILRYVGETEATVWVETDASCEVAVLGCTSRTFCVDGCHYALVHVQHLVPGSINPYEVHLDGLRAWPEDASPYPPSVIQTSARAKPLRIIWGSCRVAAPHTAPDVLSKDDDPHGRGIDAAHAYALRMTRRPQEEWPQLMLWLGDQVYADGSSPGTREFIRRRRDPSIEPGFEVANLQEYRCLYQESWSEVTLRWLLSTVANAMIFDDHDVHDDWNTSAAWRRTIRAKPWWEERIVGAFSSYWLYQHLGNLSPDQLARDQLLQQVRQVDDGAGLLRAAARKWDAGTDGSRWSYCRDLGRTRLVVIDSRAGRLLEGVRKMVDEAEWSWIVEHCTGDFDHLVVASSLPVFLQPGLHWLEAWNERVAGGAWGRSLARVGERIRQRLDLEHWAAFEDSFHRLIELVREVASGQRGGAPATLLFLSGDVHHAYLAEISYPPGAGVLSRVYQGVCSPIRNPLGRRERAAVRLASSRPSEWLMRSLAALARVRKPGVRWRLAGRPIFDNQVGTLDIDGMEALIGFERPLAQDRLVRPFERLL